MGSVDVVGPYILTLSSALQNNGGTGGLTKTNGGTLILGNSNNTYTGTTTVAGGTLEFVVASNNIAHSPLIDVKSGALLDVSNVTSGFKLAGAINQTLEGKGNINGAVEVTGGSHLDPGESVGTLTGTALQLDSGSIMDYEFNTSPANDFFNTLGNLTINGGGFNLLQEGTLNPFDTPGTYHMFGYAGTLLGPSEISAAGPNPVLNSTLSVLNPQPGFTYAFSNNTGLSDVDLTITAVPEPSSWALAALGMAGLGLLARRRSISK